MSLVHNAETRSIHSVVIYLFIEQSEGYIVLDHTSSSLRSQVHPPTHTHSHTPSHTPLALAATPRSCVRSDSTKETTFYT